jgi:lipopolysaccharide/colanic/teichoic acid biosynthesis glycosyltransferase
MTKMLFDYLLAILGIIILSPFLLIARLLVKLITPKPVFFIQGLIGLRGKEFILKSLRHNNEYGLKKVGHLSPFSI